MILLFLHKLVPFKILCIDKIEENFLKRCELLQKPLAAA